MEIDKIETLETQDVWNDPKKTEGSDEVSIRPVQFLLQYRNYMVILN